jgi:hypothetical protein
LGVSFERCEDKGDKSAPKFILSSTYHKEEATIKFTKVHYPSNPKSSFNLKREAKKTLKPRVEAFICIFCDYAGHLDEFCFQRKRIEKMRFDYTRNSYRDEFINFPPRSYSCALPRTYSRALPQFSHESNHHSYSFGSRENRFMPRRFEYDPHPHRCDHFPHNPGFLARGFHTRFEPRHLDGPHFFCRGSRPTRSNGDV